MTETSDCQVPRLVALAVALAVLAGCGNASDGEELPLGENEAEPVAAHCPGERNSVDLSLASDVRGEETAEAALADFASTGVLPTPTRSEKTHAGARVREDYFVDDQFIGSVTVEDLPDGQGWYATHWEQCE